MGLMYCKCLSKSLIKFGVLIILNFNKYFFILFYINMEIFNDKFYGWFVNKLGF